MKHITGIGGIFFRASDPTATAAWYSEHLGVPVDDGTYAMFPSRDIGDGDGAAFTVWSPFARDTDYFGSPQQQWMINFRVSDLDATLADLESRGVTVLPKREEHEYGRFAWIEDLDGNRVELFEPKA